MGKPLRRLALLMARRKCNLLTARQPKKQIGGAQLAMHFKYFFAKKHCGFLNWRQRVCGFLMGYGSMVEPISYVLGMITMPIHLILVGSPIIFRDMPTTLTIIRLHSLASIVTCIDHSHRAVISHYGAWHRADASSVLHGTL